MNDEEEEEEEEVFSYLVDEGVEVREPLLHDSLHLQAFRVHAGQDVQFGVVQHARVAVELTPSMTTTIIFILQCIKNRNCNASTSHLV